MTSMAIRPASIADLPGVLALYAQPDMDDGAILALEEAETIFARMCAYPDYALMVAIEDDAIVGSLALLIMDNLGHLGAKSAIVEDIVVAPAHHGKGIGTALVRDAMARASAKKCYKLVLSSNMKRTRAHALYERLGFRAHGLSFWGELPPGETT